VYDHTLKVSVELIVTKSLLGRRSDPIFVGLTSHETTKKTAITKSAVRREMNNLLLTELYLKKEEKL
jgi:hypothetical protein